MTTQELKLNKLKELIQLADSGLTREEFTANFKIIIDLIKSLKLANQQERESLLIMMKSFEAKMSSDHYEEMEKMDKEMTAKCETETNKILLAHEAMVSEMDKKMETMAEAMPDEALIAKQASDLAITAIKPLIVPNDDLKLEIPKLGDLIADTISGLLGIDDIKDLKEELEELRKLKTQRLGGGGFNRSAMEQYFIDDDTPVEVPNGVITDFTPTYSFMASSLKVFNDGQRMKIGAAKDYTIVNKKVVYNTAPLADVIITFDYRRE